MSAEEIALDFAKFLEEMTTVIYGEKITVYRYCDSNNECGNYILDDIFTVWKEKYLPVSTSVSTKANGETEDRLSCGCKPKERAMITFTENGDYCGGCGKLITTAQSTPKEAPQTVDKLKRIFQNILSHENDDVVEYDPGECLYKIFREANEGIKILNNTIYYEMD